MKTKEELPEWFTGELYKKGDTVRNRFSGEECELTAEELSMYDFVMGATTVMEMQEPWENTNSYLIKDLRKGLDWFRKNNSEAYMILLD
jgi:hypothetical protein